MIDELVRELLKSSIRNLVMIQGIIDSQETEDNGITITVSNFNINDLKADEGGESVPPKYADGSFRLRKNGIWEYRFMHLDKQTSVYSKDPQKCYDKRTVIIAGESKAKETCKAIKPMTYGELLTEWFKHKKIRKPPLSKSSIDNIERCMRLHITDELKAERLSTLTPRSLELCLNSIDSSRMREYTFCVFSDSLSYAKANDYIKKDIWKLVDRIKHKSISRRPLEDKEYELLLENAEPVIRRIIIGYCWTGCRRNELLSIKWSDLKNDILQIWDEKNKKWKFVPLLPPLANALGKRGKDDEKIFKANPGWVNKHMRTLCDGLKLYDISIHNLRHTFGSVLYDAGVPIKTIQLWLGHSTLKVTEDLYTKRRKSAIDKDIKELIEKTFKLVP